LSYSRALDGCNVGQSSLHGNQFSVGKPPWIGDSQAEDGDAFD